ncbi:MAG TPA: hypothetical protein VN231_05940 [Allosphingosinicella sp.]|nr:hypothetical protein [Allosphingosinicella sp.]
MQRFAYAQPASAPAASSGVAWIDRKVSELHAARAFLGGLGYSPRPSRDDSRDYYRLGQGWRVSGWLGTFSDDQLIDFAKARGFRTSPASAPGAGRHG